MGILFLQYSRELDGITETNIYDQTRSYPAGDEKISVVNRHVGISQVSNEDFPGRHQVYQENWYDALGRRVLVRARKSSACNAGTHGEVACKSFIERTTWDGDQIIIEKRTNGAEGLAGSTLDSGSGSSDAWGTVVSVHAHGIDQPVVVRNVGRTSIAPHANWMGDYQVGTTANGTVTTSCNGASDCPILLWPGSKQTIDGLYTSHPSINTWWGSLITEKADPSGYKYMRNRYYNPQTGQFTQADPIGLAGGVNLYGFADGDPVNFDDPFGLCPPRPLCPNAQVRPGVGVGALSNAVGQLADATKAFVADYREEIAQVVGFVLSRGSSGGGRIRMQPDPRAAGPHTTIRLNPQGKITNHETWQQQTNPQNPAPWESVGRVDIQGAPHYNKVTKQPVPPPHVHDPKASGGVRPAHPSEIPRQ